MRFIYGRNGYDRICRAAMVLELCDKTNTSAVNLTNGDIINIFAAIDISGVFIFALIVGAVGVFKKFK